MYNGFSEKTMKETEKILKSLANRRRLAILKFLKMHKSASVGEIAEAINLSFKATSRHLGLLFNTDILEKEQVRLQVYYRLAGKLPIAANKIITIL